MPAKKEQALILIFELPRPTPRVYAVTFKIGVTGSSLPALAYARETRAHHEASFQTGAVELRHFVLIFYETHMHSVGCCKMSGLGF